ncbi:MAG: hypothetical protein JW893_07000 [Candidatus Omnitrophica bacterium]|nr:hypothetical protein [Candidatus Omnitrophota bacterium]
MLNSLMRTLVLLLIGFGIVFGACQRLGTQEGVTDTQVDIELTQSQPPASPPDSDPGIPQKGFEQDSLDAYH